MAQVQLDQLREAAAAREWNTILPTTAQLFTEMGTFPALEIVVNQLQSYLPVVEAAHAEHSRILRELLVAVVAYGFAPDNLPEYIVSDYDTAGSGQFAQAVLEMCRAMQKDRAPEERFRLLASAVGNAILAELASYWYGLHPDLYARIRANRVDPETGEYSDPDAVRVIPLQFWIDEEVAARDSAAWGRIADAIEAKLTDEL